MEQVLELLRDRTYQIPKLLLFSYHKLGLTDQEFIMIFYLWNSSDTSYNPKQISNDLGISLNTVLEVINTLSEKGFLSLNIVKLNNIRSEVISLDLLYEKMAFLLLKSEYKKESKDLFSLYEKELGRPLSPTEIEIIHGWLDSDATEEMIILALKEAIYNGTTNLRYIDRIIFEWLKKGIKTKEDVEKNRKTFKKAKSKENQKLFTDLEGYDWLNDSQDS